jgi:translocation and assembly module TamA
VALNLRSVAIEGVDGDLLDNLKAQLEVLRIPPERELTEAMLAYQLRQLPGQVSAALEPFGYYDASVEVDSRRNGSQVSLQLKVQRGEPVRVTARTVELIGPGGEDLALTPLLIRFRPQLGEILRHARYEASKARIQRGLLERGYFRARGERARIEVTRATRAAVVDVAWTTGPRFLFGATEFSGSQLREGLLTPLLPYREGEPYDQAELLRLHRALVELDYFGLIDIQPDLRAARRGRGERGAATKGGVAAIAAAAGDPTQPAEAADGADDDAADVSDDATPPIAPIIVSLTPAKRTRYSAGLSFGTDSGASLRAGLDRRWVNDRGHKFKADAEVGQRRSQVGVQYRIPAFEWLPGWWSSGLSWRDEEIGGGDSEIGAFSVVRSARWRDNQISAELNVQSERFQRVEALRRVDSDSLLVYPALRLDRVDADDLLYPSRGYSLSTYVRAGSKALASDVDFVQAGVSGKWIRRFGEDWRVLLRAELASTWVDDFERLPPSLRNYAGGDRSVRGYGYQELGPSDALGEASGARHLAVGSAELERRIAEQWAVAAFVDAGNAFDGSDFELAVGVGLGLRWRSPVGPVRIDLGRGLDDPDRGLRIHIGIGPEL